MRRELILNLVMNLLVTQTVWTMFKVGLHLFVTLFDASMIVTRFNGAVGA